MKRLILLFGFIAFFINPASASNMFGGSEDFCIASLPDARFVWDNKAGKIVSEPYTREEAEAICSEPYEGGGDDMDDDDDE